MKICMFTNTYLPHVGGVARSVSTFAEDLRRAGHEVLLIAPTFPEVNEQEEQNILRVPAIQQFNGSDFSVRIPVPGIINDSVAAFQPDLVHSHHPFLLGDTALRTARSFDLPLIFTHHTLYEQYTHYVPLDSDVLKRFVIALATEYANLCHRVIAPSEDVKNLLLQRGVTSIVEVLPTGIDLDFFNKGDGARFRQQWKIEKTTTIIGHVGRLAREKNLPFLAESVARAITQLEDVTFLIAGTGDAERDIKDIFRRHRLEDRLFMVGNQTGSTLADCYAAMDLFVFASQSETQGLVLAEAMATATPVVALEASGVNDVLRDDYNGIKLGAGCSEKTMATALVAAIRDQNRFAEWRRHALTTAEDFSRQKTAAMLIELYQATLDETTKFQASGSELVDSILLGIKAEWELLQEKATAAVNSFGEDESTITERYQ